MTDIDARRTRTGSTGYVVALIACAAASGVAAMAFFLRTIRALGFERQGDTIALALFAFAGVLVVMAALHLQRQARVEREAHAVTERLLRHTDQLQQLTATLSRARTPGDVIRACLPDLLHAT